MDKKKLIMGGVAVILIAGGVFLFTGKSFLQAEDGIRDSYR